MDTGLRILHLISGDLWAGAEMQAFQTLIGLKAHSNLKLCCVLFNEGILAQKLRKAGVEIEVIPEKENNFLNIAYILSSLVRKFHPDVLHVHHIKEHFIGILVRILTRSSFPLLRTMHGLSGVPPHLPLGKRIRSSVVVGLDHRLLRNCCQGIIAVSRELEENLRRRNVLGRIWHIPNALELSSPFFQSQDEQRRMALRREFGVEELFWICIPARLAAPKNLGLIVDAAVILRNNGLNFRVSVFGDGPLRDNINSYIIERGMEDSVVLHGFRPDILELVSAADLFVLCSSHEGLPMALLEAMALQKPVVCTAVGGMKEVVHDGENGLLVSPGVPHELAMAITRIMQDATLSQELAINARRTIEQKYSISKACQSLCSVYQEMAGPQHGSGRGR